MQIFVHSTNSLSFSPMHRTVLEAHVGQALEGITATSISVSVFFASAEAHRTGDQVTCRMVAEVPDGPALVTESAAPSAELAATVAADELTARVRRYWERRHTKDRHGAERLATPPPADAIDAADILNSLS